MLRLPPPPLTPAEMDDIMRKEKEGQREAERPQLPIPGSEVQR